MDLRSRLAVNEVQEMMTKTKTKKTTRKRKSPDQKNKPLKVVYISNPMRVHTSAHEFRALVQELTGRDAEFPDPTKFHLPSFDAQEINVQKKQEVNDDEQLLLNLTAIFEDPSDGFLRNSYESLEDILTRDMMENLSATSSSVESTS